MPISLHCQSAQGLFNQARAFVMCDDHRCVRTFCRRRRLRSYSAFGTLFRKPGQPSRSDIALVVSGPSRFPRLGGKYISQLSCQGLRRRLEKTPGPIFGVDQFWNSACGRGDKRQPEFETFIDHTRGIVDQGGDNGNTVGCEKKRQRLLGGQAGVKTEAFHEIRAMLGDKCANILQRFVRRMSQEGELEPERLQLVRGEGCKKDVDPLALLPTSEKDQMRGKACMFCQQYWRWLLANKSGPPRK